MKLPFSNNGLRKHTLGLLFLLLGFCTEASAQVFLNEVCADNETILVDQFGNFSDWIEIYNASDNALSLQDYQLSDDPNSTSPWLFPDLTIAPKSHLLVFASGADEKGNELHTDFKISKNGEALLLKNAAGELIDQLEIPALAEDLSYGRQSDGVESLVLFSTPSPNAANGGNFTIYASTPQLLNETFFQEGKVSVELQCTQANCNIRYTTDGSIPTDTALLYQSPIELQKTTTLRFATFIPNAIPSATITRTFFIDSPHTLPIVALTVSPEVLFDPETGIFQSGPNASPDFPFYGANFWSEQTYPSYIEFFTPEQTVEIEFPIGAKIHGGTAARTKAQKPIRLIAKDSFETDLIVHKFFEEKEVNQFKRLILRNSSGDFNFGHMRDALIQRHCLRQQLDIDLQAYRPMAYYVNGRYWGIINLREKADEHFLRYNYNVDLDQLDFLEEDTILLEGSFMHLDSLQFYAENNDLSEPANFVRIEENFDLPSMTDYFSVQTIVNNADWPKNNLKLWRERKAGAKWRYLLFDLDAALGRFGWTSFNSDGWAFMMSKTDTRHVRLLQRFLQNENFKNYFLNRYADLLNTSFHPDVFQEEIKNTADENRSEMKRHLDLWNGDFEFWNEKEVPRMMRFAEKRPEHARQHLVDYFQLAGVVQLELNTYPEGAGKIKINTIDPLEVPWEGIYFRGIPVEISIEANPGFTFSHWQSLYQIRSQDQNENITYSFDQDDQITAFFTETSSRHKPLITPNPFNDLINISLVLPNATEFSGGIYDTKGQLVLEIPTSLRNAGLQSIDLSLIDLPDGLYFLRVIGEEDWPAVKLIKNSR